MHGGLGGYRVSCRVQCIYCPVDDIYCFVGKFNPVMIDVHQTIKKIYCMKGVACVSIVTACN